MTTNGNAGFLGMLLNENQWECMILGMLLNDSQCRLLICSSRAHTKVNMNITVVLLSDM